MESRASTESMADGQEASAFDFLAFVGRVRASVAAAHVSSHHDPAATLEKARFLFDDYVAHNAPLPPRMVEETRQAFGILANVATGVQEYGKEWSALARFEFSVRIQLLLYHWHLKETVSRDAADAAMTALVNDVSRLTRKQRGRPRTRRFPDVVAAKRLRDQGLSFGQIATKNPTAFRDAKAVQLALRHDFPDQPPPNSHTENSD